MLDLTAYLEDLEARLDVDQEEALFQEWLGFARRENPAGVPFAPRPRRAAPSKLEWPQININDALANEDLMVLSQLGNVHAALARGGEGNLLHMRANYGVGNISTMFGAELFIMPYETNTLPNVRKLPGGEAAIQRLIDQPLPSHLAGNGRHLFSMAQRFLEIQAKYPKLGRCVIIDPPDPQSPFDTAELLWGSEVLLALYETPELVHGLLRKITDQMKGVLDAWVATGVHRKGVIGYFGQLGCGGIFLRNDSATNVSPAMYDEFVFPYDQELLRHFGGGGIHFCGRGDHWIDRMARMEGLGQIDISQPHLNDMGRILENTLNRGINLFCSRYTDSLAGYAAERMLRPVSPR